MHFVNETSLEFNEMFGIASEIFSNPSTIHNHSLRIAQLLYEQSNHPHIKSGELYVAYLSHITLDNVKVEAIGIFKSEMKQNFLQFEQSQNQLDILLEEGVNVNKLDKGCLIFNANEEEGYKILSTEGKQEEILFMNRAVNHFAKNDEFEETHFLNEVLGDKVFKKEFAREEDEDEQFHREGYIDLIPEFKNFKENKGKKYYIEDVSSFPIVNKAVSDMRKKIKNTIELDTNIQIQLDFINPESAEKFVEKGWDEERGMFYYLIYFNEEKKS